MQELPKNKFVTLNTEALAKRFGRSVSWPTNDLFGLPLVSARPEAMAKDIVRRAAEGQSTIVNFLNAHCVNVARSDEGYREALCASDLVLPDGIGIELAGRMQNIDTGPNLNGTDLFPHLCEVAAHKHQRLFLLGGRPGVAKKAGEWAQKKYPKLEVSGTHSGYFTRKEEEALIAQINATRSSLLLVGLGVPNQEKWIAKNKDRLKPPVVMGVGGLFDYYSGRIPRAPDWIRKLKSEWVWRLAMEPSRMAKRYLWGNATFLAYAAYEAVRLSPVRKSANLAAKRMIDLVVSIAMIFILLPLLVGTALSIWLEDRGPVFFKQTRIGEDGTPFEMLKFRSMYQDAEARREALVAQSDRSGTCFKMRSDPRITKTGKFIRRFSIDELPQLFNVVKGSMALVGPRPALPGEVASYQGTQWQRLYGKPGLTCTWQVRGRAEIPFERQAIMDRAYLKNASIWVDIKLLASTPMAVLAGRGAY